MASIKDDVSGASTTSPSRLASSELSPVKTRPFPIRLTVHNGRMDPRLPLSRDEKGSEEPVGEDWQREKVEPTSWLVL